MFRDPNAMIVLAGVLLLAFSSGLVGTFTFLRKRALVGDAVAHSILPGVCLAFMIGDSRNMLYLMLGALIAGWLSLFSMDVILRKSKIKSDTATALVLSVFFAAGIFLLTIIQQSGKGAQSGLDQFLFGKAAAMLPQDVLVFAISSISIVLLIFIFYKPFKIVSFNADYGRSIGMKVGAYEFLLSTLTVLAVASGIQAVGVVLMAALLITPAAAARFWTDRLSYMLIISAVMAMISAFLGTWISYTSSGMPTGPWIIMVLSVIAVLSIFIAPKTGILAKFLQARRNSNKILLENALKSFYLAGEKVNNFKIQKTEIQWQSICNLNGAVLTKVLRKLNRMKLLLKLGEAWQLSDSGIEESKRIVRLHRLWELYLNQRLNLKPDHVHEGAEAMEHLITPELEALLSKELGNPELDPHNSQIPYSTKP